VEDGLTDIKIVVMAKRNCNVCGKSKSFTSFKSPKKLTCKQCEFRWYRSFLRYLSYRRKLSPYEKFASRMGYMGAGFLIAAQWTIEPKLYIAGFICIIIQTSSRKQWNLVALNVNGLIAWFRHLIS
tara:strand:- start:91 stop:468 length:378 start_codon:yes stop_codon:yes gene_type:complete